MARRFPLPVAAAAVLVLFLGGASAEPGDLKGQDAMGDKGKSANDGLSQAPVPREESAGKGAANPGGESMSNKPESPGGGEAKGSANNSGPDDPQKPQDHRTPNPSGSNPASPSK